VRQVVQLWKGAAVSSWRPLVESVDEVVEDLDELGDVSRVDEEVVHRVSFGVGRRRLDEDRTGMSHSVRASSY
jgi:hypothetical protein